jgi:hypothetical protein
MTLNPEFRRNLWLQLSPQRLLGAPIVLGTIFVLAWLADDRDIGVLGIVALVGYYLIVGVWGTRRAADTIAEEVSGGTWDGQRMSALGAWPMAWGKLAGGTSFVWYAGLICLAVYAAAEQQGGSPTLPRDLLRHVEVGLFAQLVALVVSLILLRKQRSPRRLPVTLGQLFGLLAGLIALTGPGRTLGHWIPVLDSNWSGQFDWYGLPLDYENFSVLSLAAFILWGFIAVYRLMRVELQFRCWPWVWIGFVLFVMAYVEGFLYRLLQGVGAPADWLVAPFVCGIVLVYVAVFAEPKDPVRYRWFFVAMRRRDWSRAAALLPQWLPTYVLAAAIGLAAILLGGVGLPITAVGGLLGRVPLSSALLVSGLLFVLRDVAFILLLNLGPRRRRGDVAAVIYLWLLYGPVTAIIRILGLGVLQPFIAPTPGSGLALAVLPPFLEIVILLALIRRRWSVQQRAFLPAVQPA